jgi:hypothetical protein
MRRTLTIFFVTIALAPHALPAQVGGGRAEDVETLDGILTAYYEVVSRPAGTAADRARDEWIHHPAALVAITGVGADGKPAIRTMTLSEYHDRFGAADEEPFYEREVHRVVQRFGNIAHVWSTYASSREPGGEAFGRGINSIQLYFDGGRWWITSWVFDQERAGNEIPAEFLPVGARQR